MASQKETFMAKWTEPLTNELVSLLVAEVKKGNHTTCTYNKTGWNNIHTKFNKRTGLHFSIVQLKNKVNKLKRHYGSFKKLLSQSGFGWDNVNNTVAVTDQSVWETHIKNNSEWAKFKNDGFPQYLDLCIELDENPIDDGAFTPNVTITLDRQKRKLDRTPNSKRRRKSNTYDVSNACKAIHKMIKFKTRAVVAILNGMPNLEQDLYNKAVNQSCLNATWREAFIISLPDRRRGLLESL
ncbi:hypothetical protein BT93_C1502 [Corymbia citriodora subsp. variegata]|nr:hypothetical protein BT93_C1502 [Corymbia citriodora subsp. variegata]